MNNILYKIMILAHRLVRGVANRILDKSEIRPRNFSNKMLRNYASFLRGDIINVSGWRDEDGEGGHYRSYYKEVKSYTISNIKGHRKGLGSAGDKYKEVELDLLNEVPSQLVGQYDVVFNHTTLEHVYKFELAFKHICQLSRNFVVIVVPVMQQIHQTEDFGDYWRPTTMTIARMFLENGFEPLVIKCNDQPFAPIYCFAIATKKPNEYINFPKNIDFQMGSKNYGSSLKREHILDVIKRD